MRADFAPAALSLPPPVPWVAVAAVLVAGLVLGAVGMFTYIGYRLHRNPLAVPPAALTEPASPTPGPTTPPPTAASDTEVAVGNTVPAAKVEEPAPQPAVPDAKPSAPPGRVTVRSTPEGASVTIDGKPVGRTPLTSRDLALGAHSVVLSRAGFVSQTHHVSLTRRAPSSTITVTLKAERAARVEAPAKGAAAASLAVDSRPRGARVTIDGRAIGVTPLDAPELAPGVHSVRVELAGYQPVTTKVTVKAGEAARLAVTLEQR